MHVHEQTLMNCGVLEENLEVFTDIGAVGLIIKAMSNHLKVCFV